MQGHASSCPGNARRATTPDRYHPPSVGGARSVVTWVRASRHNARSLPEIGDQPTATLISKSTSASPHEILPYASFACFAPSRETDQRRFATHVPRARRSVPLHHCSHPPVLLASPLRKSSHPSYNIPASVHPVFIRLHLWINSNAFHPARIRVDPWSSSDSPLHLRNDAPRGFRWNVKPARIVEPGFRVADPPVSKRVLVRRARAHA